MLRQLQRKNAESEHDRSATFIHPPNLIKASSPTRLRRFFAENEKDPVTIRKVTVIQRFNAENEKDPVL